MTIPASSLRIGILLTSALALVACVTPTPAPPVALPVPSLAAPSPPTVGTLYLDSWMLDVGLGSCVYVACPESSDALVVGCGTTNVGGTQANAVVRWINQQLAVRGPASVLVSHGDLNHYSLLSADESIDPACIDKVWLGGRLPDYSARFHQWVARVPGGAATFSPGEHTIDDVRLRCGTAQINLLTVNSSDLPTTTTPGSRKNVESVIVRLSYAGGSAILPGDAEGQTERMAIVHATAEGLTLAGTSLLVASHHSAASHDSNSDAWIEAVRPAAVAVSSAVTYDYRHPRYTPLTRLVKIGIPASAAFDLRCGTSTAIESFHATQRVFSSSDNGHILARFGGDGVRYYCERATPACDGPLDPEQTASWNDPQ